MKLKAVVYARVSTDDQNTDEKVSIPEQLRWAKEEVQNRQWEWAGEYVEPGVTGDTEVEKRPKLSQLLDDAKLHKFDVVLLYYSSRFAREQDIGMKACRILGNSKVQVCIRNFWVEPIEPEQFYWGKNLMYERMLQEAFNVGKQENLEISDKVTLGSRGLAQRGILRNAPFGYSKVPEFTTNELGRQVYTWHFDIDPIKAKIVKRIFREYVSEGGSIRQIMLNLNKDGISSPAGKAGPEAWTAATTKNILTGFAYIGKVRWGRKLGSKYKQGRYESGKARRIYTKSDKWIITDGKNFKGFIDPKIWESAKDKLTRRGQLKGRAVASPGLLSGLVVCGKCERKAYHKCRMAKMRNGKEYWRADYICQSYLRSKTCVRYLMSAKKLDEIVIGQVAEMARNVKELKSAELPIDSEESEFAVLQKARESVLKKQERVSEAYENGAMSLELYGERNKKLEKELQGVNDQIAKLALILSSQTELNSRKQKLAELLKNFQKEFLNADFKRRKDLLHGIVGRVTIRDGAVAVIFT